MIKIDKVKLKSKYIELLEGTEANLPEAKIDELVEVAGSMVILDLVEEHLKAQDHKLTEEQILDYLKSLDDDTKMQSAIQTLARSMDLLVDAIKTQLPPESSAEMMKKLGDISFHSVIDVQ